LTIAIAIITTAANAQDWKEFHILPSGDTVKPGMKVTLAPNKIYKYVIPSPYDNRQVPYDTEQFTKNKLYLLVNMQGKTYNINRLTRHKKNKEYRSVAVLLVNDAVMSNSVYFITIDEAFKAGEITITN